MLRSIARASPTKIGLCASIGDRGVVLLIVLEQSNMFGLRVGLVHAYKRVKRERVTRKQRIWMGVVFLLVFVLVLVGS